MAQRRSLRELLTDVAFGGAKGYISGSQSDIPEVGLASGFLGGADTARTMQKQRADTSQENRRQKAMEMVYTDPEFRGLSVAEKAYALRNPDEYLKMKADRVTQSMNTKKSPLGIQNGRVVFVDQEGNVSFGDLPATGEVTKPGTPTTQKAPQGFRFKQEGDLEAIPGGPADIKAKQGRPLPGGEADKFAQVGVLKDLLQDVKANYDPRFVGPVQARIGRASQIFGPGATKQKSNFYQNIAAIRNQILNLRSGAAISAQEAARLIQELPQETRSDVDFEASMDNFEKTLNTILENKKRVFRATGYNVDEIDADQQKEINKFGLQPGVEENGYRYIGGDPTVAESWEPL